MGCLTALGITAALAGPSFAQRERANWAQDRQYTKPAKDQRQQQRPQQREEPRQERRQPQQETRRPQPERRQIENASRPPERNPNRPDANARPNNNVTRPNEYTRPNNNPNRPPSAFTPPPRRFDNLNRQEQQKILQNDKSFQKLTPAQRQDLRDRQRVWDQLTPEQKNHIQNDVIPKWKQMPQARQDAIQHRLNVLRNMPESARNQHLNDPNFTRGMSEEDKAMLRDLSHSHVGAPDPPNE